LLLKEKRVFMSKLLYFDCFSGISGDMTVAALLDLGINKEVFLERLSKIGLSDEYEIKIQKSMSHGISGTDFTVLQHSSHGHARNLKDIENIILSGGLSVRITEFALSVFNEIASAEAKVHGIEISDVHFHEVGAIDSIIDVVAAAICIDMIGADVIMSSWLHEGSGTIESSHGTLPVPVPAVVEMLSGSKIPVVTGCAETELVTPTGLGILKCAASSYSIMPPAEIISTGYGLGKRDTGKINALRVILAETADKIDKVDEVAVIEANIDDCNPEILGFTLEKLFGSGALDVWYTPVHMKKNRPGTILSVMCREDRIKALAGIILTETTSIGVRINRMPRIVLDRLSVKVPTRYGEISVKIATGHNISKAIPEFESCRKAASEHDVTVREVYEETIFSYKKSKTTKI
jgi:uncharacterized protein (TIGR00299 family) protein